MFCNAFSTNRNLIKGSALTYSHVILLIIVASLNGFLLVEIPGTQKYTCEVIIVLFSNMWMLMIQKKEYDDATIHSTCLKSLKKDYHELLTKVCLYLYVSDLLLFKKFNPFSRDLLPRWQSSWQIKFLRKFILLMNILIMQWYCRKEIRISITGNLHGSFSQLTFWSFVDWK